MAPRLTRLFQKADVVKNIAAPIAFALPGETAVVTDPIAIIDGGPNLAALQEFVDCFLSRQAQDIIRGDGGFSLRGVDPPPGWPSSLPDYGAHGVQLDWSGRAGNIQRGREWRGRAVPGGPN